MKLLKALNKKVVSYFLIICFILGSIIAGTIGMLYHFESKDYLERIKLEEQVNLKLQLALMSERFDSIFSDILFLSKQNELLQLINFQEQKYKQWISNEYLELARRKKVYDQIRYLDASGMEIARVNYNNGNPEIVKADKLQFKGTRYYFKDTFEINDGTVFVSPFDLNVEKGQIEMPLKPMIRFGIPVFDDDQHKTGVIILNYLGNNLLDSIEETAKLSLGNVMVVNAQGYWLLSPEKEDAWGFMMENRRDKAFSKRYPEVWRRVLASDQCQVSNQDGLFTATTLYPLKQNKDAVSSSTGSTMVSGESFNRIGANDYFWKIVSYISKKKLNAGMTSLSVKLYTMGILLFILASVLSWIIARAIVRRKIHQVELYHSANFDPLTHLPNRFMFMERFNYVLKQSIRYERIFGLLFIDLDGFKAINDTLGHGAGDDLLINVARRLEACVRDSDTVARLGGDEFTVILNNLTSSDDAATAAEKIIRSLSAPLTIKGSEIFIGASIGGSVYPDHGDDVDLLLKKSDKAMYRAKKEGKNRFKMSVN